MAPSKLHMKRKALAALFARRARAGIDRRDKSPGPAKKWAFVALLACLALMLAVCQPGDNTDPGPGAGVEAPTSEPTVGTEVPGLNPKDAPFNAKGDGVTDDTDALQAWLTAGGVRLANGSYRVVKGLTLAGDHRSFYTENAKIIADGVNIAALTVTGAQANIRAHIDGNNKAAYGLKITGPGSVVEDGRYENFRSETGSARGIDAATSGGVVIRNNVVRNVFSVGDSTGGNENGLARGIGLNSRVPATAKSSISGNQIVDIGGEEGDAIQVLFSDGHSNPYSSGKVTISDNTIRNVSRRFVKVQASNVVVKGNTLRFDLLKPPANPSSAIAVIQSTNVKVVGNEINPNLIGGGIVVNGTPAAPLRGIEIRDNTLRQVDTKTSVSIFLTWTISPAVRNNSIYGGGGRSTGGVVISSSKNALVQGNTYHRGIAAQH